jgi:hypothetical protein
MLEGIGGQRAAAPVSWQQGHDGAGHAVQGERPDIVDRSVSRGSGEPSSFGRVGLRATGEHRYQQPRGSGCVAGQAMFPALCGSNRRYASVGTRRRRLSTVKTLRELPRLSRWTRSRRITSVARGVRRPWVRRPDNRCPRRVPIRVVGRTRRGRSEGSTSCVSAVIHCLSDARASAIHRAAPGAATEGFRRARDTAPCVRVGLVARIRSPGMRGRVHDPSPGRAMP